MMCCSLLTLSSSDGLGGQVDIAFSLKSFTDATTQMLNHTKYFLGRSLQEANLHNNTKQYITTP